MRSVHRCLVRIVGASALALSLSFVSAAPAPGAYDCPKSAPIKGNVNKKTKEKIYHTPSSRYYKQTKPERCFKTVAEAKAAGYRAPKK